MNIETLQMVYCQTNEDFGAAISADLRAAGIEVTEVFCDLDLGESLWVKLSKAKSPSVVLMTDNFFKTARCIERSRSFVSTLMEFRKLALVIAPGRYKDTATNSSVHVPTLISTVSNVTNYVHYWEDKSTVRFPYQSDVLELLNYLKTAPYLKIEDLQSNSYRGLFKYFDSDREIEATQLNLAIDHVLFSPLERLTVPSENLPVLGKDEFNQSIDSPENLDANETLNGDEDSALLEKLVAYKSNNPRNGDYVDSAIDNAHDEAGEELPVSYRRKQQIKSANQKINDLMATGRFKLAAEHIESELSRNPENFDLRYEYANLLFEQLGDYEGASEQFDTLLNQMPDHYLILIRAAEARRKMDDANTAKQLINRAIESDPYDPRSYFISGKYYHFYLNNNSSAAKRFLKRAKNLDKTNHLYRYQYGLFLYDKLGSLGAAQKQLEKAIKLNSNFGPAYAALGNVLHDSGETAASTSYFNRALALDPSLRKAIKKGVLAKNPKRKSKKARAKKPRTGTRQNPIILITGATSGIGRATALKFASKGYSIIITGRRRKRLEALSKKLHDLKGSNILTLCFDVRNPEEVKSAIEGLDKSWRNIDLLVNNAGLAKGMGPIHEGEIAHWDAMIDTNVKGILYMTRMIGPIMVKNNHGHIINVSSIAGKEVYPNGNVYCATKFAVDALTRAMRLDFYKNGIRVSSVSPGHVEETEFAKVRFDGDEERAKIYSDFNPLTSKDVADVIYFISNRPAHVNIQDVLLMGSQQASGVHVDRSGRKYD